MTTQRERERYRAARAAVAPVVHDPKEGQAVVYSHPAGAVGGVVTEVRSQAVLVRIHRAEGMPELVQKFTKRTDGEYRLAGKSFPTLFFKEEGK